MNEKYRAIFLVVTLVLLVIASITITAQEAPEPNACDPGQSMAGRCDNMDVDRDGDIDQHDKNWLYRCGWFLLRVELGLFHPSVLDQVCADLPYLFISFVEAGTHEKDNDPNDNNSEELDLQLR